jgi:hypothetical protein
MSEATCLLETGALYARRLGLRPASGAGAMVFAGFKRGAFSLYYGDAPIYHFDLEGRWQRAFIAGIHYLKGLDTTVVAIDRVREGENLVLHRRALAYAEASDLDASIRAAALQLTADLTAGRLEPVSPPAPAAPIGRDELHEFLDRVARWDASAWFAHRERYLSTYGPLPFLPPDAQQAVVLQATLGHRDGLTFGNAPAAEPYVRSAAEFAEHAATVAALLGRRVVQSRRVFLAGSDVAHQSSEAILSYLKITSEHFPIGPTTARRSRRDLPDDVPCLDGIDVFLDQFAPPLPDCDAWRAYRAMHLGRVNLGVESGARKVRALYGKAWDNAALRAVVADLKAAALEIGLLLIVGAGGVEHAEHHLSATAELAQSLELGGGDLVYLLDADEVGGAIAQERLRAQGLTPLTRAVHRDHQARLKAALAPLRSRGVKVVPYSLEKQWT